MIKPAKIISIKVQLPMIGRLFSITLYTDIPFAKLYLTGDTFQRKDMGISGYYSPIIVKNLKHAEYTIEVEKNWLSANKGKNISQ